jgi:hypothetical protein
VYDVDADAADPDTAVVRTLFRADRLLSARTIPKDSVTAGGTLAIPVPASFVLSRVQGGRRIRLGLLTRSDSSVTVRLRSAQTGAAPVLNYLARAGNDTQTVQVTVNSRAAPGSGLVNQQLADYAVAIRTPPPPSGALLAVGGLPASRAYLRFQLPAGIIESTTVVRATLLLTQRPSPPVDPADTMHIYVRLVRASSVLNADPGKAALLLGDLTLFPAPRLAVVPRDSGARSVEIVSLAAGWRVEDPAKTPRAVVLQAIDEGLAPHSALFFSTEAPEPLRPRLRLTYIPGSSFGLP